MEFAKWRFKKHNIPVEIIESSPEKLVLEKNYDFILSDAVFEHLVDPCQVAKELICHLRSGGFLLLLIDTANINDMWPMHRVLDFVALDTILIRQRRQRGHILNIKY